MVDPEPIIIDYVDITTESFYLRALEQLAAISAMLTEIKDLLLWQREYRLEQDRLESERVGVNRADYIAVNVELMEEARRKVLEDGMRLRAEHEMMFHGVPR